MKRLHFLILLFLLSHILILCKKEGRVSIIGKWQLYNAGKTLNVCSQIKQTAIEKNIFITFQKDGTFRTNNMMGIWMRDKSFLVTIEKGIKNEKRDDIIKLTDKKLILYLNNVEIYTCFKKSDG